jgi:hypothetical protein
MIKNAPQFTGLWGNLLQRQGFMGPVFSWGILWVFYYVINAI